MRDASGVDSNSDMQLGCTRQRGLIAAFFSLFVASFVFADEKPCTIHDSGKFYDLNPLKSRTDYQIVTKSGRKLALNVCQPVKTETFGLKDGNEASEIGGFIRLAHGDFSIGKFNTSLSIFDSRPRFVMSEGSRCKATTGGQPGDIRASSIVEFVCDPSVPGFGNPQLLASLPPGDEEIACAYLIEWKTSYACPTFEGGGFWRFMTMLTVALLVLSMTYTILGTLYNRFVLDLQGYDQIPQFSIESMKYHVKEGFEWTKDMAGILFVNFFNRSSSVDGYSSMPSNHPRTPNPVSHQAQVSRMGSNHDLEQGGSPADRTVFIRPDASHKSPAPLHRPLTNPVSHHTQSLSQSPPQPTPQPKREDVTPTQGASSGSTDREFVLVDDGDVEERPPPPEKSSDAPSRDNQTSSENSELLNFAESDPQVRLSRP